MEASALNHTSAARLPTIAARSPLLRLQSDEKLIALVRRGQHGAFEALVQRYESRLLAFCRHMLGSTEDAEDVLQEVFAASFNAMLADQRPINARPWLYRIARNRCLNHLRRPQHAGQDSMDVFERDGGLTTADAVHKREEFRQVVADVQDLPETQKTALLLREIDALSYDQIAEAMETTVPSVKSLLVRARVSLAEAAEARLLTCEEVRLELGHVAEGLAKTTAPVRRHLKGCERCRTFRGELRKANRALAAIYPLGPLVLIKKLFVGKLGLTAGGTASSSGAGMAGGVGSGAMAAGASAGAGAGAGGFLGMGATALASKTAAGLAAAAIVTAGAVEVQQVTRPDGDASARTPARIAAAPPRAPFVQPAPLPRAQAALVTPSAGKAAAATTAALVDGEATVRPAAATTPVAGTTTEPVTTVATTATAPVATTTTAPPAATPAVQEDGSTATLDEDGSSGTGSNPGAGAGAGNPDSGAGAGSPPPGESSGSPPTPTPTPVAGESGPHGY